MKLPIRIWPKLIKVLVGIAVVTAAVWLSRQKKSVAYEGIVVDSVTGLPVPQAKVVLSTWHYGLWDSNPTHVGTFSDEAGRFTIKASLGQWIDNVDLSASSPISRFCRLRNPTGKTDIRIALSDLDASMVGVAGYTYDSFSGGWSGEVKWITNKENKSVNSTR